MAKVEEAKYEVVSATGDFEIRSYEPMIVAEAVTEGDRKTAINEGFRLIAGYIFGNNDERSKVAMTAPVQQQRRGPIAMTAPFAQQNTASGWSVHFVMPSDRTLATLPLPNDPRVTLKSLPARQFAAIRFSGLARDAIIDEKTEELRRFAKQRKLDTRGEPLLGFYNPPWTLPFFRRNEVLLEIVQPSAAG